MSPYQLLIGSEYSGRIDDSSYFTEGRAQEIKLLFLVNSANSRRVSMRSSAIFELTISYLLSAVICLKDIPKPSLSFF